MRGIYIAKSKFYSGICALLILAVYALVTQENSDLRALCIKSVIALVCSLLPVVWKTRKITGGLLYCICLAFMHMGQVIIVALDMEFTRQLKNSIAIGQGIANSMPTVRFSTLAYILAVVVVCFVENAEIAGDHIRTYSDERGEQQVGLQTIVKVVIALIGILAVISDLVRAVNVATVGYGAGYKQANIVLYYADMLFMMCSFLIISTYKNSPKVISRLVIFVMLRAAFAAFFIGARSDAVVNVLMCVFAIRKLTTDSEIRRRVTRVFIWICVIGVVALPFTGIARNNTTLTLSSFLQEYNPISYSLTEFGGTIINVRLGIAHHGELPISDFFKSFLSIIPMSTVLIPGLQTNYGGGYSAYLNSTSNGISLGLGGSLIGEAAFWFGTGGAGLLYILIIVIIVASCMNTLEKNRLNNGIAANTATLFLLYEMFYHIRGSISDFQSGIKLAIYFFIILKVARRYVFYVDGERK